MSGIWLALSVTHAVVTLLLALMVLGLHRRLQDVVTSGGASPGGNGSITGLEAGSIVPPFEAVDEDGRLHSSAPVAGPLLMLLTMPGCQPCDRLTSALADLDEPLQVPLVIVTADTERGRSIQAPSWSMVLFQRDQSVTTAFDTVATPNAFLLDAQGRVVTSLIPATPADLIALAGGSTASVSSDATTS